MEGLDQPDPVSLPPHPRLKETLPLLMRVGWGYPDPLTMWRPLVKTVNLVQGIASHLVKTTSLVVKTISLAAETTLPIHIQQIKATKTKAIDKATKMIVPIIRTTIITPMKKTMKKIIFTGIPSTIQLVQSRIIPQEFCQRRTVRFGTVVDVINPWSREKLPSLPREREKTNVGIQAASTARDAGRCWRTFCTSSRMTSFTAGVTSRT